MRGGSVVVSLLLALVGAGCGSPRSDSISGALQDLSTDVSGAEVSRLMVDGRPSLIIRDRFGIPHILAQTNRGLFVAYGYAVAQDRLWQLETHRRAGRGTLSEMLGRSQLPADTVTRTEGYSDDELDAMFAGLTSEEQTIFEAYVEGINRYISEVVAADPVNKLPFEFAALALGVPAPYSTRDLVAFLTFLIRRFGEIGGRETRNQALLASLVGQHGEMPGYQIFNDVRWLNDPDAPVTVPQAGATSFRQLVPPRLPDQLQGAVNNSYDDLREQAIELWRSLGVPTKLGSYAWAVSPERSANGAAMLYGGPQMGFSTPEVVHNVELIGGNGFNVVGMGVAGGPGVIIGHNRQLAWTLTTQEAGDNLDIYRETLCDAGSGPGSGYEFNQACVAFESRVEVIQVRFEAPVNLIVERSIHGPVIFKQGKIAYTQRRAHWMRELDTVSAVAGLDRVRNLNEFQQQVAKVSLSFNVVYADQRGNIGYFVAGLNPVRAPGFDLRLPFPGDGSAEWTGELRPNPSAINPAQGWLANWNNKPSADYDSGDEATFGKIFRVTEIQERLAAGPVSVDTMKDIPRDIARVKGLGREARFLKPYLLAGLDGVPPSHPLAAQARAVVESWDGNAFEDALSSTSLNAGEVIFSSWLGRMISDTFADELGDQLSEASSNMLLHVLDFAFTGQSGVPPSRDYFNGVNPSAVISRAFDTVVAALAAALGEDPAAWTGPRGVIAFTHALPQIGTVATIPNSNRSTYGQVVVLRRPFIRGENIFSLGQSGFIKLIPPVGHELDPHFMDLLPLYRNFEYKPMGLIDAL